MHLVETRNDGAVPVSEKYIPIIKEAATHFNIGIKKLKKKLSSILQKYSSFYLLKVVAITEHKSEHRLLTEKT